MREANQTEIKMARAILGAVKLQQDSYDNAAADAATAKYDEAYAAFHADPANADKVYYGYMPDYKQFYTTSLEDACELACDTLAMIGVGRVIYLALDGWWNDTIYWAQQVLDPTAVCVPTNSMCQHGHVYVNNPSVDEECATDPEDIWACQLCKTFSESLEEADHESAIP